MAKEKKQKLYWVHWYTSSGFCYRSTHDCTWEDVQNCRRTARALDETIKYERM